MCSPYLTKSLLHHLSPSYLRIVISWFLTGSQYG